MSILKSRKAAFAITAGVMVASTLLGCHRSLAKERNTVLAVFEQGAYGDGIGVGSDLGRQQDVCANLSTVARRYLPGDDADLKALDGFLDQRGDTQDPETVLKERRTAQRVLEKLEEADLSDQDARYVSGFAAELESIALTIAADPYTQLARTFNQKTLGAFPASVLGPLTGVRALPVYQ